MSEIANVVLVHGAFADGSSWAEVVAILQARGLKATAVQNPLTSLAADVAATKWVLDRQDGPTVLVGHSYGGVVITEAGGHEKVASLVYVAAMGPEVGEPFSDLAQKFPAAPGGATIEGSGAFVQLTEAGFLENFAQDLDPVRAKTLAALQGPISATLFGELTTAAAWKEKPNWYAVSQRDRMIAPELERFVAERMKATTIELDTSHASPVTRPQEIAQLILQAAGQ